MKIHWHASVENVILYGVSAIIVIDVLGLTAAWLTTQGGFAEKIGTGLGAIIPFKG